MSASLYAWGTDPKKTLFELHGTWVDFCNLTHLLGNLPETHDPDNYEFMHPLQDYVCVILFWLGFNVDDVDMPAAENAAWRSPPGRLPELSWVSRLNTVNHYKVLYFRVKARLKTLAWGAGMLADLRRYLKKNPVEAVPVATQLRLIFKHSADEMYLSHA